MGHNLSFPDVLLSIQLLPPIFLGKMTLLLGVLERDICIRLLHFHDLEIVCSHVGLQSLLVISEYRNDGFIVCLLPRSVYFLCLNMGGKKEIPIR